MDRNITKTLSTAHCPVPSDNDGETFIRADIDSRKTPHQMAQVFLATFGGLGHLLNPIDPQSEDRNWIGQSWLRIIRKSVDLDTENLCFEQSPAVGHTTISSPAVIKPLTNFNEGKRSADQIKPFNFLWTCHVRPLGHPPDVDSASFHLIAPYEKDPRRWLQMNWIDQYSEQPYGITTAGHHGSRHSVRVKTLR
jgi:hypothetical protein